jgi:hypothetical protein
MVFSEQKPAYNQLVARVAFMALGKYTVFLPYVTAPKTRLQRLTEQVLMALEKNALFLPTLLARKSSLPRG